MERRSERWLKALDRLILRLFFRSIEVEGAERVPSGGPLIVVANHVNGLIDPMLVLGCLPLTPRFLGKSTLWDIPPLRPFLSWAQVIPVYRRRDAGVDPSKNAETFAASRRVLAEGGVIALFPEGQSHSEPALAPLKTGVARIALEAEAEHGPLGVRILPVGLVFDAKDRFRSRALVEVGEPFDAVGAAGGEVPRPGGDGGAPREAVRELTAAVDAALQGVTVNFRSWDEARLVRRAAAIHARPELDIPRHEPLAESAARVRVFAGAYQRLAEGHPEEVAAAAEAVRRYERLLAGAGLRDRHVAARYHLPPVSRFLGRTLGNLLVRLPLAAVGTVLNAVPYQLVSWIARLQGEADQRATYKVFPALALYPLTWVAEAVTAGWLVGGWAGWLAALAVLGIAPWTGAVALRFHDRRSRLQHEIVAFLRLRTRRRFAAELRAQRAEILRWMEELEKLHRRDAEG